MSERIYAWLLHLYPTQFRESFGEEALQLFRDRSRDEKGLLPKLRLWLDLLCDLAISVPGTYRYAQPVLIGASAQRRWEGGPFFDVLEDESPRFGALLFGGVLSIAALSGVSVLLMHAGDHPLRRAAIVGADPGAYLRSSWSRGHAAPFTADAEEELIGQGSVAGIPKRDSSKNSADAMVPAAVVDEVKLDATERQAVIDGVIRNLKEHYVDRDAAQKMADALLAHAKSGDDGAATDGAAFADLLTRKLRGVSHDMHLEVVYSQDRLPDHPGTPSPESLANYRRALEQENCTFESFKILPHNIGYLKLNSFPDVSICRSTAVAAMASLNHADAIIFDLRDNRGGDPEMVKFIAAYLFDHPEYMYSPRESPTEKSWTQSPVPGNRLADKPVYVLTSRTTWSGAEQLSYDLKMLKRATLVGETTRGGAHAGVFYRIDDHFGMGIPEVKVVNPFSKADWEGVGVEPDVKVTAADALETAQRLAEGKLGKK